MNIPPIKKPTNSFYIGISLICFAALLFIVVKFINSRKRQVPVIFSPKEVLENTWNTYKVDYLEAGSNRTLDKQQNNLTTSEGQSYTMLRAVWMDDKATFDASLKWTQDILKHKNDNLHAWVFGEQSPGNYTILTSKGGQNSATDAETDMAMSLLFAYGRWGDQSYMDQAQALIADIWKNEVVVINGKPVLVANDVEHLSPDKVLVDPSYFAPYEYRMFAAVDSKHDWQGVIDSSYDILTQSIASPLDKNTSANIPPDWVQVNRQTGAVTAATAAGLTTNYGYDALRVPWRLALDWQWYGDPRDKQLLDSLNFFSKQWTAAKSLSVNYAHDGTLAGDETEVPALYGGVIGYFIVSDPKNAAEVYNQKLAILYNPDTNAWRTPLGYYDDNWTWFGIGLYQNLLPNLVAPASSTPLTN
jgi:endoglucanase